MGEWISLICVLLTANLDTALLAMGWSLRRRRFTLGAVVVIGVVTTAATWLALTLGHWAAGCLTVLTAKKAGGALLIAMGVWMMIDALREEVPEAKPMPVKWGECLMLSLTLAGNNMGLGIGAGLAGATLGVPPCATASSLSWLSSWAVRWDAVPPVDGCTSTGPCSPALS